MVALPDAKRTSNDHENPTDEVQAADEPPIRTHMSGWRLYILTFGLCLSLLLSTLETTIVSTSLVSITNALSGFENRDWVVTSYLLTYTGFLVIYAKFSDIFGIKFMMLLALLVFTAFSIVCGAATGMTELIILRAFQGIGGSGIYSMVGVVATAVLPAEKYGKYMAIISSVMAISAILGPLLGGAINDHTTWRWVFLLNAPAGAAATAILIFFLPSDFSKADMNVLRRLRSRFTVESFSRVDILGCLLMLCASILVVFALEEAGSRYAWSSVAIVGSLVIAGVAWIAFVSWEMWIEQKQQGTGSEGTRQEPIFPMRLLKSRVLAGMLLNAFFAGFPFTSLVVNIPQRFQAVNGTSPSRAGISLLPLLLMTPFASGLSAYLVSNQKLRIPPLYLVLLGSCLQLIGVGLDSTISTDVEDGIQKVQYAYEVLMGLGFGLLLSSLLTFIPLVVEKKDMPIVIGAVTQVRVLGGTIGLAISTVVLNSYIKTALFAQLSAKQITAIAGSLSELGKLSKEEQIFVRTTFAEGYNRQTRITLVFSAVVVLSCSVMVERKPRRLGRIDERGLIEVDGYVQARGINNSEA
ncbi:putative MFS multidrug transporter [Stipitochalara longipes BDJ]|nr:putative MFS multidrug transporter [Stipitochalara longipes BDJ]